MVLLLPFFLGESWLQSCGTGVAVVVVLLGVFIPIVLPSVNIFSFVFRCIGLVRSVVFLLPFFSGDLLCSVLVLLGVLIPIVRFSVSFSLFCIQMSRYSSFCSAVVIVLAGVLRSVAGEVLQLLPRSSSPVDFAVLLLLFCVQMRRSKPF